MNIGSIEDNIVGEISDRLYPEYDGEKVTFQDYGWKTPEGDIVYVKS